MFKRLNVLTKDNSQTKPQNIATKDLATDVIQICLLHAETLGQNRLMIMSNIACWQSQYTELGSPLDKNKVHTILLTLPYTKRKQRQTKNHKGRQEHTGKTSYRVRGLAGKLTW